MKLNNADWKENSLSIRNPRLRFGSISFFFARCARQLYSALGGTVKRKTWHSTLTGRLRHPSGRGSAYAILGDGRPRNARTPAPARGSKSLDDGCSLALVQHIRQLARRRQRRRQLLLPMRFTTFHWQAVAKQSKLLRGVFMWPSFSPTLSAPSFFSFLPCKRIFPVGSNYLLQPSQHSYCPS